MGLNAARSAAKKIKRFGARCGVKATAEHCAAEARGEALPDLRLYQMSPSSFETFRELVKIKR